MGLNKVLWGTLTEFMTQTTIGGLCNAGLASSRYRIIIWLIIFTVLSYFTLVAFFQVIDQYLQYGVTTSTDLSFDSTIPFPAITICNKNKVHCQNLFDYMVLLEGKLYNNSVNDLTTRYKQLADIYEITGCSAQVCQSIAKLIPPVRNASDSFSDLNVIRLANLGCPYFGVFQQNLACYFLLKMSETASASTNPTTANITSAWSYYKCTVPIGCTWYPPNEVNFVKPKVCPTTRNSGTAIGGAQTSGAGSGGTGSGGTATGGNIAGGTATGGTATGGTATGGTATGGTATGGSATGGTATGGTATGGTATGGTATGGTATGGTATGGSSGPTSGGSPSVSGGVATTISVATNAQTSTTLAIILPGVTTTTIGTLSGTTTLTVSSTSTSTSAILITTTLTSTTKADASTTTVSSTTATTTGITTTVAAMTATTIGITTTVAATTATTNGITTTVAATTVTTVVVTTVASATMSTTTTSTTKGLMQPQPGRKKRQVLLGLPPPLPSRFPAPTAPSAPAQPPVSSNYENTAIFLKKYMQLSDQDRASIGHKLLDGTSPAFETTYGLLHSCTYAGRDCTNLTFWMLNMNPNYGNCYSFNAIDNIMRDAEVPRTASLTGRDYGLSLELFIDQENYMLKSLSESAGAKLVIHNSMLPPLTDEYGIDLKPNTDSSVAIQATNISRQPYPYETFCIDSWDETGYNVKTDVNYSIASCQRFKLQYDIVNECNCFHPNLVQAKISVPNGIQPCLITPTDNATSDFVCFSNIMDQYNSNNRTTTCNNSCSELQYSASVSKSTWPSDQYWRILGSELPKYALPLNDVSNPQMQAVIKTQIQNNYAKAEIYFQTLNVVTIQQTPTYDIPGLLSTLGGTMGLFTGFAIIMCFEVIELMFDIVFNTWKYFNMPRKQRNKKIVEEPPKKFHWFE